MIRNCLGIYQIGVVIVELVIGVTLALIIFRIQSKTDKLRREILEKINESTTKIDSYVEKKQKLDDKTKRFHCNIVLPLLRSYIGAVRDSIRSNLKLK